MKQLSMAHVWQHHHFLHVASWFVFLHSPLVHPCLLITPPSMQQQPAASHSTSHCPSPSWWSSAPANHPDRIFRKSGASASRSTGSSSTQQTINRKPKLVYIINLKLIKYKWYYIKNIKNTKNQWTKTCIINLKSQRIRIQDPAQFMNLSRILHKSLLHNHPKSSQKIMQSFKKTTFTKPKPTHPATSLFTLDFRTIWTKLGQFLIFCARSHKQRGQSQGLGSTRFKFHRGIKLHSLGKSQSPSYHPPQKKKRFIFI